MNSELDAVHSGVELIFLRLGISSTNKREQRKGWLDPPAGQYKPIEGANDWQRTGEAVQLIPQRIPMKLNKD